MKKTIAILLGLFLLCNVFLILAETEKVECTSNKQCPGGSVCINWECITKEQPEPGCISHDYCASGLCIDGKCVPKQESNNNLILVGAGIIVILLIIIVYLIIRKKKK